LGALLLWSPRHRRRAERQPERHTVENTVVRFDRVFKPTLAATKDLDAEPPGKWWQSIPRNS